MGSMSKTSFPFTLTALFLVSVGFSGTLALRALQNNNVKAKQIQAEPLEEYVNNRPIIGIVAQELYEDGNYENPTYSHIAASYVKFIEGGGGRVVPILINRTEEYYQHIFERINGVLFPGGGVFFNSSGYSDAGKILLDLALKANDRGDYFPIWGTCLGFEYLVYNAVGDHDILARCNAWNVSEALKFTQAAETSKLYGSAPKPIIKLLTTQKLTANFHHWCLTKEIMLNNGLDKMFNVLSWNYDANTGITYVSSMESFNYPIFGVQFHPEKNLYEWNTKYITSIPHSREATQVGQYFAEFFVNEARRSNHTFESEAEENKYLIYNYSPVFTGAEGSTLIQKYLFPMQQN